MSLEARAFAGRRKLGQNPQFAILPSLEPHTTFRHNFGEVV